MSIFGWDLPPGCSLNDIDEAFGAEDNIVPTVEFGFDLTIFGGDYDYGANTYSVIYIPVDFYQEASQGQEDLDSNNWETFERFTGFDRAHWLYTEAEENEEQTQDDLDSQEVSLSALREAHYQICSVCQRTKHTRYSKGE